MRLSDNVILRREPKHLLPISSKQIPDKAKKGADVPKRTLTVEDIILMQKQLEAAQRLNNLLSETVAQIENAVRQIDLASVKDQNAAAVLEKVKTAVTNLEKELEVFNKSLR
jgi:hypothetical protein